MEFEKVTEYIAGLYKDYEIASTEEFVSKTEAKDFCSVIQTETARLMRALLRFKRPQTILEIGTSIGYSATSMATVAKDWGGRIITIELDEGVAEQAERNFAAAGVADVVEILVGDALDLLPRMEGSYDFIFLDSFNVVYPRLLADCVRLLNHGGMLVADDTLFPVLKEGSRGAPLDEYNRRVAMDANLESTLLPVGDGVTIAVKK